MADTKRLFVLRHAKSSWDDPGLEDHERPLAPRGRQAVRVLREHMRAEGIAPELILCSSARRTRQTLEGIGLDGETLTEDALYSSSPGEVLARLQRVGDEIGSVMVVGHNPTMQMLVLGLTEGSDPGDVQRKFPTGALATLEFEGRWGELAPGRVRLTAFVRPKQLAAG